MPFWLEIIINLVFAWLAAVGFGLIINVPHRALVLCGISGSAGWILYWLANRIGVGRLGSNLLGALCVGILGLVFARIKKCPVTVFWRIRTRVICAEFLLKNKNIFSKILKKYP